MTYEHDTSGGNVGKGNVFGKDERNSFRGSHSCVKEE